MKSGNLNFLEPSGPLQACNGIALPLFVLRDKEWHWVWEQSEQHKIYWVAAEALCFWWTTVQLWQWQRLCGHLSEVLWCDSAVTCLRGNQQIWATTSRWKCCSVYCLLEEPKSGKTWQSMGECAGTRGIVCGQGNVTETQTQVLFQQEPPVLHCFLPVGRLKPRFLQLTDNWAVSEYKGEPYFQTLPGNLITDHRLYKLCLQSSKVSFVCLGRFWKAVLQMVL
jgi:hypothetical protein